MSDALYRRWREVRRPSANEHDGVDEDGYYFVLDYTTGRKVFVSHQRRLGYYTHGVTNRVSNLAREYCVDDVQLGRTDCVVDVGAHSGEFGLWVERFGSDYLGIEPDPIAFGALQRNLPNQSLEQVAAGAQVGEADFYLATSTGDSSLGATSTNVMRVKVETLDEIVGRVFPGRKIAVLKIEAEGFEPEVLAGAEETLKRTERVTVDAGEERQGNSTAPECINLLLASGFTVSRVFLRRGIFLFESA